MYPFVRDLVRVDTSPMVRLNQREDIVARD